MSRIVGAWAGVVAAVVLASSPGQAIAHALVLESNPAQGATLTAPPPTCSFASTASSRSV
jgi:Copper resistance protein CopC.